MSNSLAKAYLSIFKLKPEEIKVCGLRKLGKENGEVGTAFKLEAIICAKTDYENMKVDENACTKLRNRLRNYRVGGNDIIRKISLKDKSNKKHRFVYSTHLVPKNILKFRIVNGDIIVNIICHGSID